MTEDDWKTIALHLFYLLDDIDTAGDIFKEDLRGYREAVESRHRRRFDVATTDGYGVYFKKLEKK